MLVAATLKYARISPQKCRLVANVIRGKSVDDALRALTFSPKKSAGILKKILESAVANAEHNLGMDPSSLIISSAQANMGPVMKRYRPRAQGRAFAIKKQTCHISISVQPQTNQTNSEEKS